MQKHRVQLMVRSTCGSCARVEAQIRPLLERHGVPLEICDVDSDVEWAAEFGDRVPVVVLDGEEFACWEVDNEELGHALLV
ncbi:MULTISPECIES: glutaredoxin family protein [unclassified Corynebacterium]|uniref:glutaredoxin family protein n=1 Tax=unclassified Corynebacterium TaxID=2624378 RepID=UPI0029C9C184|nr:MULTISPECIES: glutaredoxin family protein [unclassified Corynebacterium]WPF66393.1 glutaredoxin family protein [Corynebacterium sp. 22KM0430]WPF68883.1 glutaredoxin family protein [Corynebacterium sp. 21KM1197]